MTIRYNVPKKKKMSLNKKIESRVIQTFCLNK